MKDPTRDLVERARAGDEPALEDLLVRHLETLRMFVRLKTGQALRAREAESDILSSVCREVLQNAATFEYQGERAFKNWLFQQTLRKILNKHRALHTQKRDVRRDAPLATGLDYGSVVTPSRVVAAKERVAQVEAAFDALPEDYREAVILRRIVGLSYAEIGEQLGRTEKAARNLVHRGVARLTALVEG